MSPTSKMVYVEPSFPRGRKTESAEDGKPRKKFRRNTVSLNRVSPELC